MDPPQLAMTKHFTRDLENLKKKLMQVGSLVEEAILGATQAFMGRDRKLAKAVIEGDALIDNIEVAVEEECLKILALHQPVAADLRFVVAVLKVNNDLERMGDLAVGIAKRAKSLTKKGIQEPVPPEISEMLSTAHGMVRKCLDSLVEFDANLARQVLSDDDAVDALHKRMFGIAQAAMKTSPEKVEASVYFLSVSRQVEHLADLATNIAEDVIFMEEGVIVRHRESRLQRLGED